MAVLEMKAGQDSQDKHHGTALSYHTESSHGSYAQALMDPEAFLNQTEDKGRTPLLLASQLGRREVVKLLLNTRPMKIKAVDKNNQTALS